ncbi:MAG: AI-2E family transporter [Gammaproteobacteria bacterium]
MSCKRTWLVFFLLVIVLVALLLHFLGSMLIPFVIAALLAFLANPAVRWMVSHHIPRTLATSFSFIVILLAAGGLVLLIIPLIEQEGVELLHAISNYLPLWNSQAVPWIRNHFGVDVSTFSHLVQSLKLHLHSIRRLTTPLLGWVTRSSLFLVGILFDMILIPILTFYLLKDWDHLVERCVIELPESYRTPTVRLGGEIDKVLSAFFRGQLLVMAALALSYTLGLSLIGLHVALLIGCFAGLMSFVPYLGFFSGVILALLAMFLQGGGPLDLLGVLIVFAVGEGLESFVYIPFFIGGRTHLHPVAVIFAILAGGTLFGFVGVLLAVPCAAVLSVLIREAIHRFRNEYPESIPS